MENYILSNLGSALNVREDEWAKAALLFCLYFNIGVSLAIGRNFSEAVLVAELGVEKLPIIFVYNSIVVILFSLIYNIFADRIKNHRILIYMTGFMVVILACILIAIETLFQGEISPILIYFMYVAFVAFSILIPSHFATYLQDHYDQLDSKRLMPIILTSSRFGGIIGGILVSLIVTHMKTTNLLSAWIFFLVISIVLTSHIERKFPTFTDVKRMAKADYRGYIDNLREGYRYIANSQFLIILALSVFTMYFMRNYLDYLNNAMFARLYTSREELIEFYGRFSATADAAAALLQLFIVPRLISRLRVGPAGLVFPFTTVVAMLLIAFVVFYPGSGFLLIWCAAAYARFNRFSIYPAFNNPVYALFFNAVPIEVRGRARGVITGLVLPMGTLISGLIMLFLVNTNMSEKELSSIISILGVLSASVFLYVSHVRSKEYSKELIRLLEEGRFDELKLAEADLGSGFDRQVQDLLINTFHDAEDELALFSAEILVETAPQALLEEIPKKVLHPDASNFIQEKLVGLLDRIEGGEKILVQVSQAMINDDSEDIRALTIELLDHYHVLEVKNFVIEKYRHGTPLVRRMATVYLLHHGNSKEKKEAYQYLLDLIDDDDPNTSKLIYKIVGKTKDKRFLKPLFKKVDISQEESALVLMQSIYDIISEMKKTERIHQKILSENSESDIVDIFTKSYHKTKPNDLPILALRLLSLFDHVDSFSEYGHYIEKKDVYIKEEGIRLRTFKTLAGYIGDRSYKLNDALIHYYRSREKFAHEYLSRFYLEESLSQEKSRLLGTRAKDAIAIMIAPDSRFKGVIRRYLESELRLTYQRAVDLNVMLEYRIGKIDDPIIQTILNTIDFFESILSKKSYQAIQKVIRILGEVMNDSKRMESIRQVINSENPRHRAHALETLENNSIASVVKFLQPLMDSRLSVTDMNSFARKTFNISSSSPADILHRYTQDNDSWIRAVAIELTGLIVGNNFPPTFFAELDKVSNAIFLKGLTDPNPFVREASCVAIRRRGYVYFGAKKFEEATGPLYETLYEFDQLNIVRMQAIQTLIHLTREHEYHTMRLLYEEEQPSEFRLGSIHIFDDIIQEQKHLALHPNEEAWIDMLSTIEKAVALRKVPIFTSLSLEQLKTLSTICTEKQINKGIKLFSEGEPGDRMYVILDGEIDIIKDYGRKNQIYLTTLKSSASIGEMSIFNDSERRSASAVAREKTRLLMIEKREMKALIYRYPDISFSIIQGLSDKIRQSNQNIQDLEAKLVSHQDQNRPDNKKKKRKK
ncbi:MAG: hypothetical protein B6244_12090 [Candidatus Cloacimonetes bacterium 4572_55]|nr:MAG: hypothetical protein B6244_12090 [Candidatus Cloacimonetes bacterium 4572_55]